MADKGWQREFDKPIETPDGARLTTLSEAVAYLAETVPKAERDLLAVTTAAEMLTNAAERRIACLFLAPAGTLKAIHRHEVQHFNPDANEHHWGKREAEAGSLRNDPASGRATKTVRLRKGTKRSFTTN